TGPDGKPERPRGVLTVWDLDPAEPLPAHRLRPGADCPGPSAPVRAAAFAPDGETLVSADETGALVIRGASSGEARASVAPPLTYVASLDFLPGGQALQGRGSDDSGPRTVRWDLAAGRAAPELLRGPPERIGLVAFSADEKTLATFPAGHGQPPEVKLW